MSHEPLPLKGTCQLFKFILTTFPIHRTAPMYKSDLCVRRAAPLLGDHAGRWKLSLEVSQGLSGQALTGTPNPQLSHHRRPAAAASFTTHAAQYAPVSIFSTWSLGRSTCTWISAPQTAPAGIISTARCSTVYTVYTSPHPETIQSIQPNTRLALRCYIRCYSYTSPCTHCCYLMPLCQAVW